MGCAAAIPNGNWEANEKTEQRQSMSRAAVGLSVAALAAGVLAGIFRRKSASLGAQIIEDIGSASGNRTRISRAVLQSLRYGFSDLADLMNLTKKGPFVQILYRALIQQLAPEEVRSGGWEVIFVFGVLSVVLQLLSGLIL